MDKLWIPPGLDQLDIVEPVLCHGGLATAGVSLTAQAAYLQLVRVPVAKTVTKLSCYTSAPTANIDMSIMDATYAEIATISAPVAAAAGGLTTGTLTAAFTYQPGVDYYHVILLDASVSIVRGYGAVAVIVNAGSINRALQKTGLGQNTVPSSISSPAGSAAALWIAGHN